MSASNCKKNITQTTYVSNNKAAWQHFSFQYINWPSHLVVTHTHIQIHINTCTHTLDYAEKRLTQLLLFFSVFFLPTQFGVQVNASEWPELACLGLAMSAWLPNGSGNSWSAVKQMPVSILMQNAFEFVAVVAVCICIFIWRVYCAIAMQIRHRLPNWVSRRMP